MKFKGHILIIIVFFINVSTTCVGDKKNYIKVENKLDIGILCIPIINSFISEDDILYKSKSFIVNSRAFAVGPLSTEYIGLARTPLCLKKTWDAIVDADELNIYILNKEIALQEESFEYDAIVIKILKVSYYDLVEAGCKIVIEP